MGSQPKAISEVECEGSDGALVEVERDVATIAPALTIAPGSRRQARSPIDRCPTQAKMHRARRSGDGTAQFWDSPIHRLRLRETTPYTPSRSGAGTTTKA